MIYLLTYTIFVYLLLIMNLLRNITSCLLVFFVLLMSTGFNISKIDCHDNNQVFFGIDAANCQDDADCCSSEQTSCCVVIEEETCCDSDLFNTCAISSLNVKYDFITTVLKNIDFVLSSSCVFLHEIRITYSINKSIIVHDIDDSLLYKPILSFIQVFLI